MKSQTLLLRKVTTVGVTELVAINIIWGYCFTMYASAKDFGTVIASASSKGSVSSTLRDVYRFSEYSSMVFIEAFSHMR